MCCENENENGDCDDGEAQYNDRIHDDDGDIVDVVLDGDGDRPGHRLNAQVVRVDLNNEAGHEAGVEVTIPCCK